jgi:putative endopeptidase
MGWGFDTKDIDRNASPRDDFYQFSNGGWLKRNTLPKTEPRWGTFIKLRFKTEHQLRALLLGLLRRKRGAPGSPERMMADFFRSGMDKKRRNTLGLRPLLPYLSRIEQASDIEALIHVMTELNVLGVDAPFGVSLDQDAKHSDTYMLYLHQDGLGMPDREYYLSPLPESKRVRDAYLPYMEELLRLSGKTKEEAKRDAKTVFRIETMLAKAQMDKVTRREIEKTYNKKTLKELQKLCAPIDWKLFMKRFGAGSPSSVIVMQPAYFKALGTMFRTIPLPDWKTYLSFHLINDSAPLLSEALIKHRFSFYGTTLAGVKVMKPMWRQVLAVVNGSLGELFGQLYVKKHFSKEAKEKANMLVRDLFVVYESRMKGLDWMSAATKKKAVEKLRAMRPKIGFPNKWKSYKGLKLTDDDYFGNVLRSTLYEHKRELKKLKKKVNRNEWYCLPQVVNAFYNPSMNDMTFPAGILQPPFFDPRADDAVNYGAIGAVIGHEMTHGFDDEGAKFDKKGNLKSWWTPKDKKRFEAKGKVLVNQFNQYEVDDGVKVNGKLTLGENIADLGGLAIAYDAYQRRLEKTGRKTLSGFTPEQRFFLSFAKFECELIRPEYQKMLTLNDTHSPGVFRINGPVSNHEGFYSAFGVTAKNKLYRTPKARAKIW